MIKMMKVRKTAKLTAMLLASVCSLAVFTACPGKKDPTATATTASTAETPTPDFTGRLDGYTVVYPGFAAAGVRDNATKLAKIIGCESKADKGASGNYADDGGLEILVGDTDRTESAAAKDALTASGSKRAYNYSITITDNNRIVIVGDKPDAVAQAVSDLVEKHIEKRDDGVYIMLTKEQGLSYGYDLPMIVASNGVRFRTELVSQLFKPNPTQIGSKDRGTQYPAIVLLEHQQKAGDNGILLATMEYFNTSGENGFRMLRSTDGGENWKQVAIVSETIDKTLTRYWEPHLFELPVQVGDMPAGTVLLSGTTIDAVGDLKSHITIWRSFNQGKSWEQYSIVTEAGGLGEGVWEPCIIYENGMLYCFYSDDSDPKHDQKLSFRKSTDGKSWGDATDICVLDEFHWRPGMVSVAKMGNGKYFLPYELCSNEPGDNGDVYFRITDDLDGDWKKEDHGTKLTSVTKGGAPVIGRAPWCTWIPAGGECGTLIVSAIIGCEKYLYVSFDYGESFEAIENPIPFDGPTVAGYSPSFFPMSDGKTLLYAQTVPWMGDHNKLMFARIKIEESLDK